jgi:hypothetical protein
MTNKELLQLQDTPEGRKVLGEYLVRLVDPNHEKEHAHTPDGTGHCRKCKLEVIPPFPGSCPIPDPITIDDSDACKGMALLMFTRLKNYRDMNIDLYRITAFELLKIIARAIKEK